VSHYRRTINTLIVLLILAVGSFLFTGISTSQAQQPESTSENPATTPSPASGPSSSAPVPVPPTQPIDEPQKSSEPDDDTEREVTRIPLVGVELGGVLLQREQLVIEPTVGYSIATNTRLIVSGFSVLPLIVLGDLESEKVTTQTFIPSFGFRYGLARGWQLDFRLPYLLQSVTRLRVSTETAGQVEENSETFGVGDISFGLSYQFLYERGWYPDMVLRLGATAPTGRSQFDIFRNIAASGPLGSVGDFLSRLNDEGTALGTGRWFIDASISAVKAMDPAILFGTIGYSYAPPTTETLIRITANPVGDGISLIPEPVQAGLGPVNQISQSLGMAIALNNRVSMNFSFSNLVRFATKVDGQKIPDSNIHVTTLNLGFIMAMTPQTTTNITGSVGLTPDAPDFAVTLTFPMSVSHPVTRTLNYLHDLFFASPTPNSLEPPAPSSQGS
jgi:hypothetical protein